MGKIFTSITGPGLADCKRQLRDVKYAELRLDKVRLGKDELDELWPLCSCWMVTARNDFLSQLNWNELFSKCLSMKPLYVDIGSEIKEPDFSTLMLHPRHKDTRLILSYHNYERTPSYEELRTRTLALYGRGAQVVKLACMVNDYDDNVTLLRLYAEFNNLITIGMGEKGRVSRLNALYFGEMVSYAASSQADALAPGQFTHEEMRRLEKAMECD